MPVPAANSSLPYYYCVYYWWWMCENFEVYSEVYTVSHRHLHEEGGAPKIGGIILVPPTFELLW